MFSKLFFPLGDELGFALVTNQDEGGVPAG
jgi:hypothetical protein